MKIRRSFGRPLGVLGFLIGTGMSWGCLEGQARGGMFDPAAFASLGAFPDGVTAYEANTDDATIRRSDGTGPVWQGVVASGSAVFTFDTIDLLAGASIRAVGTRSIALLSQGDVRLAEGSLLSVAAELVNGGPGGFGLGVGPGAGGSSFGAGAGGGHGGAGGEGGYHVTFDGWVYDGGIGGEPHGDAGAGLIGGGSGSGWIPGGGGGALELSALGEIFVGGLVTADGADGTFVGGGGAGGMIRMLANRIELASGRTVLSARGGDGSESVFLGRDGFYADGGGGGGGRVLLRAHELAIGSDSIDVAGGSGYGNGGRGVTTLVVMPEPATWVSCAVGMIGLGLSLRRGRRNRRP